MRAQLRPPIVATKSRRPLTGPWGRRPHPPQIDRARPFVPLGTDGFGRSDTREALRRHFEIDAESVATASLHALALCEQYGTAEVAKAIAELSIDPNKPEPRTA